MNLEWARIRRIRSLVMLLTPGLLTTSQLEGALVEVQRLLHQDNVQPLWEQILVDRSGCQQHIPEL